MNVDHRGQKAQRLRLRRFRLDFGLGLDHHWLRRGDAEEAFAVAEVHAAAHRHARLPLRV